MSYAGSNLNAILDRLTQEVCADGGSPLANALGAQEDAQNHRDANRVVWVQREIQTPLQRPHEQPVDETTGQPLGKAKAQETLIVDALSYGPDFEAARRTRTRIVEGLYGAFSENAANIFGVPSSLLGGGAREAGGFVIVLPVEFLVPVYAESYRTSKGKPDSSTGEVQDPQGQNAEPIS